MSVPGLPIAEAQQLLLTESDGRIDPLSGGSDLQSKLAHAVESARWTREDLVAVARAVRSDSIDLAGKRRKTVTLADLAGYHRDFTPLANAIIETRERAARKAQAPPPRPVEAPRIAITPEQARAAKIAVFGTDAPTERKKR